MKRILIFNLIFSIAVASCRKEESNSKDFKNKHNWYGGFISRLAGLSLSPESDRIYNMILASKSSFDFIHTNNYGQELNVKFGGVLTSDATIKVNSSAFYGANLNQSTWYYLSQDVVHGENNSFVFRTTTFGDQNLELYVPHKLAFKNLSDSFNIIDATASTIMLSWNPDTINPMGQIVLQLITYSGDMTDGVTPPVGDELILTEDDGSFDIKAHISPNNIKFVNIIGIRGNAGLVNSDTGPVFINIRTQDHHAYQVTH